MDAIISFLKENFQFLLLLLGLLALAVSIISLLHETRKKNQPNP